MPFIYFKNKSMALQFMNITYMTRKNSHCFSKNKTSRKVGMVSESESEHVCVRERAGHFLNRSRLISMYSPFIKHPLIHRPNHSSTYLCAFPKLGRVGGSIPQNHTIAYLSLCFCYNFVLVCI